MSIGSWDKKRGEKKEHYFTRSKREAKEGLDRQIKNGSLTIKYIDDLTPAERKRYAPILKASTAS
jgi:hypothetical protein